MVRSGAETFCDLSNEEFERHCAAPAISKILINSMTPCRGIFVFNRHYLWFCGIINLEIIPDKELKNKTNGG